MGISRRGFLKTAGLAGSSLAGLQLSPARVTAASVRPAQSGATAQIIRLDSNENPYGPSGRVQAVIREALGLVNRYPTDTGLAEEIASFHHVKPEQILTGCGSSELLRVAAAAFLGRGQNLVVARPTFEGITDNARSAGADVFAVPLNQNFAHDTAGMLTRANAATRLVYICNPNNPTGTVTPRAELEAFVEKLPSTTYVLIDEAYHHYAGQSSTYASFVDRPLKSERIIVTRTFSAVYGLAGLRVGYAVAPPRVIERMRPHVTLQGVNTIATQCAVTALTEIDALDSCVKRNADDRQEFINQATARMLKPIDSHANFVMMNAHRPADQVIQHFREHNIAIGPLYPPMNTYVRVSLGARDDMKTFWRVWDLMPSGNEVM